MNELKIKSGISKLAAECLIKNLYFASSVHCNYYSCYQFCKHIWLDVMKKTDEEFASKHKSSNEGSHNLLYTLVFDYLKPRASDNRTIRNLRNDILQLKKNKNRCGLHNTRN